MYIEKKLKSLIENTLEYNTKGWFQARDGLVTASDLSSVFDLNKYQSRQELLNKKLSQTRNEDSKSTIHGKKFEPIAIDYLSKKMNVEIHEPGLKIHDNYDFIGATPDGIFSKDGELFLLEIKCPLKRKINGMISYNYFCQMQLQLEVWDVETCYFLELEIEETEQPIINKNYFTIVDNKYIYIQKENLVKVSRDRKWFQSHLDEIRSFNNELKNNRKNNRKRKRKNMEETDVSIISKKRKTNTSDEIIKVCEERWFSTNHLKDYVIDDKLHTWLNLYGEKYYQSERNCFNELILQRHSDYKLSVINDLNSDDRFSIYNLPTTTGIYNPDLIELNRRLIKEKKYDILINVLLNDEENKLYSKLDMLFKGRVLKEKKLFFTEGDRNKIHDDTYYPVNICLSRLELLNNKTFSESKTKYKYYRVKSEIESSLLNKIQEKNIDLAFVWNNGIKYSNKVYEKHLYAYHIKITSYMDFIDWFRYIENKSKEDILNNETFYPILIGNKYSEWEKVEKMFAIENKELTLLNNLGLNIRRKVRSKGVYSFDDPKLFDVLSQVGMNKININMIKTALTMRKKLHLGKSKSTNWLKQHKLECYVDFETVNDFCADKSLIYLIGMYVPQEDRFFYFKADSLEYNSELKIINEWFDKIDELSEKYKVKNPPVYHWAPAEKIFLNIVEKREKIKFRKINFVDIYKNMKNNEIVIKGNYEGYGLKKIVKHMFKNNLIEMNYSSSKCTSGDKSIIYAIDYYKHNNEIDMDNIIHYNRIDCEIMFHIIDSLRNY